MRTLLLFAAVLLVPSPLVAQGWIQPRPGGSPAEVVRLRTDVAVRVEGRIAHVEVEEWFENRGGRLAEGDYLYPIPGGAVFSEFSLFQGDDELRGEMMDAERARAIYEAIVRQALDPALIELVGHGLLRARVFPIGPGETRRVTLRYTQVLERAGDALELRYFAGGRTAGPRHVPGVPPRPAPDRAPLSFSILIEEGDAYLDPFSPTHTLRVEREAGRLRVRPAREVQGDVVVFLPPARDRVGLTHAAHRSGDGDGYFMLTLSPAQPDGPGMPRDMTIVLDVSGSMSGAKMEQARRALHQLLGSLEAGDRFRLIAFSTRVTEEHPDWSRAEPAALDRARRWVDGLRASGGTDIAGALEAALREPGGGEDRLAVVVFVTDGLPTVGERDPDRIAERAESLRGDTRVFAFGVGYDLDAAFLDRLTLAGRGSTAYVRPEEDVEAALSAFAAKVRYPVLADLRIDASPVRLREVYPSPLPDLFAGEELVIFGRYETAGRDVRGDVVLAGRGEGRSHRFAAELAFPAHSPEHDFIPRLWAARRIGHLVREARLRGGDAELEQEIRETALRYGVLSEYTAYLVQEPHLALPGGLPRIAREAATQVARRRAETAVLAADDARRMRATRAAAELADAQSALQRAIAAGAEGGTTRVEGGRLFTLRDGVWTDRAHEPGARVVEIAPFGEAYFEFVRRVPELRQYLAAFDRVLVAGSGVSLRVAPGGVENLPEPELDALARAFRRR